MTMRLDLYLSERGLTSSRTEAKNLINNGKVSVCGHIITKPSFEVDDIDPDAVSVDRSELKYVSRGGLKLEGALKNFSLDPSGKNALDIGSSSGGFTDCLLQNGANHVIAVDSGRDQMVQTLAKDPRVTLLEGFNARYMSRSDFEYVPNLAVMDVSFISATLIIPAVYNVLDDDSDFVCLIKPQFEVGRSGLSKGGIVRDNSLHRIALDKVISSATACGFSLAGTMRSPIEGGDGNVEFLAHFKKESSK